MTEGIYCWGGSAKGNEMTMTETEYPGDDPMLAEPDDGSETTKHEGYVDADCRHCGEPIYTFMDDGGSAWFHSDTDLEQCGPQ